MGFGGRVTCKQAYYAHAFVDRFNRNSEMVSEFFRFLYFILFSKGI
jgi:hypothetical protein